MFKKLFFIFLVCTLMASCFSGNLKKKVKVRVAFWGSVKEIAIIKETVQAWQKDHPDIEVVYEHSPRDYESKILTQAASGNAPDIIFTEVSSFVPLFKKGLFLPLNEFIKNDKAFSEKNFNIKDFFPEVIDRFTVNGEIYSIPRDTAPFACIYYNKNMFDQAGVKYPDDNWTMDQFLATAKKLTKYDKSGNISTYGFYGWAWLNFVYAFGGRIVDNVKNPKRCVLDSKEAVAGLQFYTDLSLKYHVMPSSINLKNIDLSPNEMFMTGRLAMYNSGIWETPVFRDIKAFDWDIAMFPKGPKGKRAFGTGGSGYCIYSKTKHPREAWEVIKCLAGEYGQIILAKSGLAQPANKKIAESEYFQGDKVNKPAHKGMLNKAVEYTIYEPFHFRWLEARQKFIDPELDIIFKGEISAAEWAKKDVPKINEVMFSESAQ